MIWTERTLCSTHAVQLRGAKPHGLECGRERGYLWVCSETAQGYLQRLRRDAAGSEALELRTALDAVTCAADEEAEAAARAVARGIDVAGCATCSSTRMRGGGSRLLRWRACYSGAGGKPEAEVVRLRRCAAAWAHWGGRWAWQGPWVGTGHALHPRGTAARPPRKLLPVHSQAARPQSACQHACSQQSALTALSPQSADCG